MIFYADTACDPTQHADLAAIVMQEGNRIFWNFLFDFNVASIELDKLK